MVKMQITFLRTHEGCKQCIKYNPLVIIDAVPSKYKQCGVFV